MSALLLGIDIGTSSVKLGLVNDRAELLAAASAAHEVDRPRPGWAQMDSDLWLRGVRDALPRACAQAGVDARDIDAVGFSAMFPVLVPLDADLRPLHPAILYCDQRSIPQTERLERDLPAERFERIAGNRLTPGTCSLTSLVWLKEERPGAFDAAAWFALAPGCVAAQWTGRPAADWGSASLSGLMDLAQGEWSEELCAAAGVPLEKLPPLLAPAERAGALRPDVARALGLRAGIPVAVGSGDTICSAAGLGLTEPGQASVTCGTTDNVSAVADQPSFDPRFANCRHALPGRWIFIATMSNTGAALEWFKAGFAAAVAGDGSYDALFAAAAQAPPGAGGLICLPYWQGERTPIWDPKARAALVGMSADTDAARVLRAVLEGVAFALRQNLDALQEAGFEPKEILLTGGGSKSAVWNQIRADALGRPLLRAADTEATLLGAALFAGAAAGVWPDLEDALRAAAARRETERIEPRPDEAAAYDRLYPLYERLYPALRDWLHERYALVDARG